jgi:hypothetical protein
VKNVQSTSKCARGQAPKQFVYFNITITAADITLTCRNFQLGSNQAQIYNILDKTYPHMPATSGAHPLYLAHPDKT